MTDEELQNKAESGMSGSDANDRAYRLVFDALKKEPSFRLPANFEDKVIRNVKPVAQRSESRELIWMYVGIGFFCIAFIICMAITDFKFNFGALKGYQGLFIFGAVFILALQWIDKRFVRKTMAD